MSEHTPEKACYDIINASVVAATAWKSSGITVLLTAIINEKLAD
jgi:hypothetical protein